MVQTISKALIITLLIALLASCAIETHEYPTVDISVKVTWSSSDMGTVSGSGTYPVNSKVTITATPYPGYRFESWDDGNTDATRTITPTSHVTYTASFETESPNTIFSEDFESLYWLNNTTPYASAWDNSYYYYNRWNRTQSPRYSGSYSLGAQGSRTTYDNNTYSALRRELDLTSFTSATLEFYEYINTEPYYDYFEVDVIYLGLTLTIYSNSGYNYWTARTVDLTPYTGENISLIFRFSSDYSVVPSGTAGVWLDNISVTAW